MEQSFKLSEMMDKVYNTKYTYYFTFGSGNNQVYTGGWVEVKARDKDSAVELFIERYGRKTLTNNGAINCAFVYSEAEFRHTIMYSNGNLGSRCHEKIGFD